MATCTPLLLYVRDILQALKKSHDGEALDGGIVLNFSLSCVLKNSALIKTEK